MTDILSDSNGDVPTLSEPTESERLLGLIGAMKDGLIITFEYRGMKVSRDGSSMSCWDPEAGSDLGGRLLMESASLLEIEKWLKAKADLYEVAG